jgi:hypothetical protein
LEAFIAWVRRWKAESERLMKALEGNRMGLLPFKGDDEAVKAVIGRTGDGTTSAVLRIAIVRKCGKFKRVAHEFHWLGRGLEVVAADIRNRLLVNRQKLIEEEAEDVLKFSLFIS